MKRFFTISLFLFFNSQIIAQNGSCHIQVSLLTCTPGRELYSTFGHSALRVMDSATGEDVIYNYGTFDFEDPNFIIKFMRGKLLYFLSVEPFQDFKAGYEYDKRGITEQILNLNCEQKSGLIAALQENAKEQNRYYKYDFVRDNCTTRLRDIIEKFSDQPFVTKPIVNGETTYRKLIHEYLDKSGQYWSKLGIDILMASPVDKKISTKEVMFLPDYLMKGWDSTWAADKKLVASKQTILQSLLPPETLVIFSPLLIFSIIFFIVAALSLSRSGKIQSALNVFDKIFFFILGILGLLILFMWFATDHAACRDNYNLLWALPVHLFILPVSWKKTWVKKYFRIIFWLSLLLLFAWFWLPQQMNNALFPIVGIIFVRSLFISKRS